MDCLTSVFMRALRFENIDCLQNWKKTCNLLVLCCAADTNILGCLARTGPSDNTHHATPTNARCYLSYERIVSHTPTQLITTSHPAMPPMPPTLDILSDRANGRGRLPDGQHRQGGNKVMITTRCLLYVRLMHACIKVRCY